MSLEQSSDDPIGRTIDGRYQVRRLLGRGGMGAVYEADHVGLDKRVAIKLITGVVDPDALARFRREARAAGRIVDDHVVEIFDVGEDGGHPYIAMEYVEGRDLRAVLRDGAMPLARALEITRQILRGLTAIHAAGIVHRDIKPANILLTRSRDADHFVKIMDFGISKSDREVAEITRTGTMVGTPQYMAPEQLLGADADHRADLYAVGLTLFAMLTGEAAFAGSSTMELAAKQLRDPPPLAQLPPDVPRAVADALERVLQKVPADRFASASAFADALVTVAVPDDARREAPTIADRPSLDETKPSGSANKRRTNKAADRPADVRRATDEPHAPANRSKLYRWLVIGGVLVALAIVVSFFVLQGDDKPGRRKRSSSLQRGPLEEAREDERAGKLELAVAHYLEAHATSPDPELLFRIGELYERMDRTAEAQLFFRRYLDDAPKARDREAVEARIVRLERTKASAQTQQLDVDAGVALPIDAPVSDPRSAIAKPLAPPGNPDEICRCLHDDPNNRIWLCKRKYAPLCRCVQRTHVTNTLCPTQPTVCPNGKCPFEIYMQLMDDTRITCSTEHELYTTPAQPGSSCSGYELSYPNKPGPLDGVHWCTVCQSSARPSATERAAQFEVAGPAGRKCSGHLGSSYEPIETTKTGTVVCEKRKR